MIIDKINEILNENTAAWLATKVKPDGYIWRREHEEKDL